MIPVKFKCANYQLERSLASTSYIYSYRGSNSITSTFIHPFISLSEIYQVETTFWKRLCKVPPSFLFTTPLTPAFPGFPPGDDARGRVVLRGPHAEGRRAAHLAHLPAHHPLLQHALLAAVGPVGAAAGAKVHQPGYVPRRENDLGNNVICNPTTPLICNVYLP